MERSRESAAPRAPATAALGLVFVLVGLGFGLTAAIVCGVALLGLALGAVGWVELSTQRGRLERVSGPDGSTRASPIRFASGCATRSSLPRAVSSPTRCSSGMSRSGRAGRGGWTARSG